MKIPDLCWTIAEPLAFLLAGFAFLGGASFFLVLPLMPPERRWGILFLLGIAVGMFFLYKAIGKRNKRLALIGAVILGLTIVPSGIKFAVIAYHNSIPVVPDQGTDLAQYQPFTPDSRVAKLDAPPAEKLSGKLPRINGATALYPVYAAFVEAIYPPDGGDYSWHNSRFIASNTTNDAYAMLIEGQTDLVFCAAPSPAQVAEAAKAGREFELTPIGREAFVFFVNADNPVTGLTQAQIRDIYSGRVGNWKELGGRDESIRAFQRREGSGSQTMLERIMAETPLAEPPKVDRVRGMGGIISMAADYKNYRNSIGFSFLFFATEMVRSDAIRLLAVDGVEPSHRTMLDGSYPFVGDFYAVTVGPRPENVQKVIDFALSKAGQELIARSGYLPLRR